MKIEEFEKIPTVWRQYHLKRDFKVVLGKMLQSDQKQTDETEEPYLRSANIQWTHADLSDVRTMWFSSHDKEQLELRYGDLLVSEGGDVGRCCLWEDKIQPCYFQNAVNRVRPTNRGNCRFLFYWLYNLKHSGFVDALVARITIAHLTAEKLERLPQPRLPLPEQKRIAAYLDASCAAIDRAVETKRKQLETLDTLRKSIIQRAVTQGLDPEVEMKESGVAHLGVVPAHWKVRRVKDVLEFHNHRRIPLSSADRGVMTERAYDYYGASGVIDKVESYLFEGRYILLAEDGANLLTRSKPLAFFASGKFWVNNHAHILKPFRGNESFWVHLLEAQDFSIAVTGSAQPKLSMQNLGRFQVPVPPEDEQNGIANYLETKSRELDSVIKILRDQITTLTAYRKSLIHECVTGQRRISDADVAEIKATA